MRDKQLASIKPASIVTFLTTMVAAFAAELIPKELILFSPIILVPILFVSFTIIFPLSVLPYLLPRKYNWRIGLLYLLAIGGLVVFVRYKVAYDRDNIDLKLAMIFAVGVVCNACLVHADLFRDKSNI